MEPKDQTKIKPSTSKVIYQFMVKYEKPSTSNHYLPQKGLNVKQTQMSGMKI